MGKGPAFAPLTLKDYISQMRSIPAGTFRMGSNQGGDAGEKPVHTVRLSRFRMGATPVTVAMWQEYCTATGTKMPASMPWGWKPTHPIVDLSYKDIVGEEGGGGYCEWASRKAGFRLMLPTEAQWEYCATDGGKPIAYPWGNRFDQGRLWCSEKYSMDAGRTSPVVREERTHINSLGLSDMAGNVWQWCRDWYGDYPSANLTDPTGPRSDEEGYYEGRRVGRCVRGGSWMNNDPDYFRCAFRSCSHPLNSYMDFGFRLSAGPA